MRFNSIKISNYRQYRNLSFEFTRDTACDMHIIVASNGVGKTNLLNAINWCLYGDEPHTSGGPDGGKNDKMPLCNNLAIQQTKDAGETICTVSVSIEAEDNGEKYTFIREAMWNVNTDMQSGKDDFSIKYVCKTGDTEIKKFGEAEDIINRFLPKKIRKYFYFDGEQLLYYFNPGSDKISHIKESIYEIAGVNTLQQVENHLKDRANEYRKTINKMDPNIEEKQKEYQKVCEQIENIENEIRQLSQEIDKAEEAIESIDRQIDGTEEVVNKNRQYNRNKDEIEKEEKNLQEAKEQQAAFIKKYLPMLLLYNTDQETSAYIEQREYEDSVNADVNVNAIEESLRHHECQLCKQHIPHDIEGELLKLVTKFKSNISLQKLAEIKSDIRRSLDIEKYEEEKNKIFESIRRHQDRINELESENDRLATDIKKVPSIDQIEILMDQKIRNEDTKKINERKKIEGEIQRDNLVKEQAEKKKAYDDAMEANNSLGEYKEYYEFTEHAERIVSETKKEIVDEVKQRLEKYTMELFDKLVWKKDTYGRVQLDDNFQMKLFHKKTDKSCLASCSASEKELLALAFTIAIHKVSGYDNLLFIDTPVGRISDENRTNFAKVLLEVSQTKQIILAFTPSEYSEEIRDVLRKDIVSSYVQLQAANTEDETIMR